MTEGAPPADRVAVVIIHGMGDHHRGFAGRFIERLRQRLGKDHHRFVFQSCFWSHVTQVPQDRVWKDMRDLDGVAWKGSRRWVVGAFGDPVSYLSGYFRKGRPIYDAVHGELTEALARLQRRLGGPDHTAPLVLLAHSLGGIIASNYVWDAQHGRIEGVSGFAAGETLVGLITYGTTIPLFVPAERPLECIRVPGPAPPVGYDHDNCRWLNIFASADVLGYPLGRLWDELHGTTVTDHVLRRSWRPVSQFPLVHTTYERDGRSLRAMTAELRRIAHRKRWRSD